MKQRYKISYNDKKDQVRITEQMEWEGQYVEMTEEKYSVEQLASVIDKDIQEVIAAIRTNNLFPPYELAKKIASSLIQLLKDTDDSVNELFMYWEDIEEQPVETEDVEEEDIIEDELSELTDDLSDDEMEDGFLEEGNDLDSIVPKTSGPVDDDETKSEDL
ncbi:MAG: hypothetical protein OMM_08369 [Candidatus Magnetoglobus multicellularis str. Araruama]|uniref:Uncharacterized protein n=1 Tax=Candidatus Magnetoglobus multicellularis str. Araruama TaxID=890399 RepID=A0A1V1P8C0_9BACT|nr:MAG: hypothetical protein OMM_08369 [Candidatus Magnetoglobus multicellularis str. Araruama]